jgi:nitrate/nitrite transport system substrate-binding protein
MRVWGYHSHESARTVDVHLSRLRAKLGAEHGAMISTIRGVGYLFRDDSAEDTGRRRKQGRTQLLRQGRRHGSAFAGDGLAAEKEQWIERLAPGVSRRPELLRRGSALGLAAAVPAPFLARGLSPTLGCKPVRIGFIALTDAASVIMAHENRFFEKRGVEVELIRQASWQATRDALLSGEIDAAHCLFALPFALATGIDGFARTNKLKVAMMLDQNGQAITLKHDWAAAGYDDLKQAKLVMNGGRGQTFAMTFPGGTHDTWLRYWLLAMGIDMSTPKIIPIPPAQMVANMKLGTMDGYCVGEPWGGVAAQQGIGFTHIATQDLWEFHPEKALVVNADFAEGRTPELKRVIGGILEASRWLDQPHNRARTAEVIGRREYVDAPSSVIRDRLNGIYELGGDLGTKTFRGDQMRFFRNGKVNFPRRGHAIWFMAQYVRFRYLTSEPSYEAIAKELILSELYKEVADAEGCPVPSDDLTPFEIKLDGVEFDPRNPQKEAART